jgi:hypothetical protein
MFRELFSKQGYVALWTDSHPEAKTPFLDDGVYRPGQQRGVSTQLHWVAHGVSAVLIMGLLACLQFMSQTSQATCWDKFNYYCVFPLQKEIITIRTSKLT